MHQNHIDCMTYVKKVYKLMLPFHTPNVEFHLVRLSGMLMNPNTGLKKWLMVLSIPFWPITQAAHWIQRLLLTIQGGRKPLLLACNLCCFCRKQLTELPWPIECLHLSFSCTLLQAAATRLFVPKTTLTIIMSV